MDLVPRKRLLRNAAAPQRRPRKNLQCVSSWPPSLLVYQDVSYLLDWCFFFCSMERGVAGKQLRYVSMLNDTPGHKSSAISEVVKSTIWIFP
ncbi:hypothetical protein CEXT_584711 [Caerostris extrusa]|uniref:Uncharacterized protein n=1 Tax=Caerostris extrusa TaxID=172846 RepID=A0AAV4P3G3_CAEEX|nr:hypothetical protein CEXT_584711 [Caerostris extrusa]